MSKLDIANEMRAFDSKNRGFYDSLTDEERKKFSTYLMLKWGANVEGSPDLQEWYLRVHNDRVNLHFFNLGKHPKLQWLICTTVSPGLGNHRHFWLTTKKDGAGRKLHKFVESNWPHLSTQEVELMVSINTPEQFKDMARQLGWDDKKIKDNL